MRLFLVLFLPLIVQVLLFTAVFVAAQGGGSFMGLLAMPVAAMAVLVLVVCGFSAFRGSRPTGDVLRTHMVIATVPPVLLLVFRAIEG